MTILLWGWGNIYPSQCEHATETIMANMDRRISVEVKRCRSVNISQLTWIST